MQLLKKPSRSGQRRLIFFITAVVLVGLCATLQVGFRLKVTDFLRNLFYLKYLPALDGKVTFFILFVFGLLTSIHCVGMCGGLMLTQTLQNDRAADHAPSRNMALPALLYNSGRAVSYTAVGAVVGGLGQTVTLSRAMNSVIPIAGGAFMIVMAINLLGIFPVLRYLQIGLPHSVVRRLRGAGGKSPFAVGLFNALMPCGPMQMIQLYALGTRSALTGAASMLVFSLGTMPGLFAFGIFSTLLSKKLSGVVMRCSAVLVAVLGVGMIGRGLALGGISLPAIRAQQPDGYVKSVVQGQVQTVTTTIGENTFPPIEVEEGIRVVWTIKVPQNVYNDCNKAMSVPAYNISRNFTVGDNIVEFTPQSTGDYPYTCWMGMIKSRIHVIK